MAKDNESHIAERANAFAKVFVEKHNKSTQPMHDKIKSNRPDGPMHPDVKSAKRSAELMSNLERLRKARGKK